MAPIVRLEKGIIPTKDTKLTLGGVISIPPIGLLLIIITIQNM
jgi:hypothetical protein